MEENKNPQYLIARSKENRDKSKREEGYNKNHSFINPGQIETPYIYNGSDLRTIDSKGEYIPENYHG